MAKSNNAMYQFHGMLKLLCKKRAVAAKQKILLSCGSSFF
jgi:hypothetical protein